MDHHLAVVGVQAVRDIWLKLRMLRLYWRIPRDWYRDVWKQDPDTRICCSGHMCGCYGVYYYEMWESMLRG